MNYPSLTALQNAHESATDDLKEAETKLNHAYFWEPGRITTLMNEVSRLRRSLKNIALKIDIATDAKRYQTWQNEMNRS